MTAPEEVSSPEILDGHDERLAELRADPGTVVLDHRRLLAAELAELIPAPGDELLAESPRWVHYPWRRTVVGLLGPRAYRRLRLDRNRNKITDVEQRDFESLRVGVVGLSVGHAIAHTIALEGLCGQLRLADFDTISLSNLNRIPVSVVDIGVNKATVAARRIAEIDPFLDVRVYSAGIADGVIAEFLDGLDVVVEECDSLDVKFAIREAARAAGIPVLMQTSDRGLLDVERYDIEPDLPILHGLGGVVGRAELAALAPADRIEFVLRLLEAEKLSAGLAESMSQIGVTLSTWPQLGSDVQLGGALVAVALRRLRMGKALHTGRFRIDADAALDLPQRPGGPDRGGPP